MKARMVAICLALLVPSARGDEDGPKERAARAATIFESGKRQMDQEHYEEALSAFKEAYEIDPLIDLIFDSAICYEHIKEERQAFDLLELYLSKVPSGVTEMRKAAEEHLAKIQQVHPDWIANPTPTTIGALDMKQPPTDGKKDQPVAPPSRRMRNGLLIGAAVVVVIAVAVVLAIAFAPAQDANPSAGDHGIMTFSF